MTRPIDVASSAAETARESRDWLDYLSAYSGLAGALLAGAAIAYAAWQAAQSKQDLIRERRLDFELRLLAEIRRQMSITHLQHLSGYVGALVVDQNDETDLPLLRAAIGTKAGQLGQARLRAIDSEADTLNQQRPAARFAAALEEVDQAIQRRIETR